MFSCVLVANRGEIAVRIIRTLRRLGIRSVAVYSDADGDARHVAEADDAVRLGPTPAAESYLDVHAVVAAALATGADAIHPGYGFLSENASLAAACARAAVTFVGPSVHAIEVMGDKINAKRAVMAAGVPVVPGCNQAGLDDTALAAAAVDIGLPVLIKPSAGGGGKGMRRVDDVARLRDDIAGARREAQRAFGDDTLLIERWVTRPRHIEIQVFADQHGACVSLGDRECSLQRRHQKIVEEAPAPQLARNVARAMAASAVAAARAVGYVGAGTVEFIVAGDRPDDYFFLEMNTRLQVEHPVTEEVTGLDLVELQLRVAAGEPLGFGSDDVVVTGHAMEARVYAEDATRGFLPSTGTVALLHEPIDRPGVRVDSGLRTATVVGTAYDPLLAKVIAKGTTRAEAINRLDAALGAMAVLGVTTNIRFLRRLLADPDVAAGRLDTELVERIAVLTAPARPGVAPPEVLAAAGLLLAIELEPSGPIVDPWDVAGGWRLGGAAEACFLLEAGAQPTEVGVRGRGASATVRVGDGEPFAAGAAWALGPEPALEVVVGGKLTRYALAWVGDVLWLGHEGATWAIRRIDRPPASHGRSAGALGTVTSPMPGTVLAVAVAAGDEVAGGATLAVVEAMKMEYTVTASMDGTVAAVHVRAGQTVALDQPIVDLAPLAGGSPHVGSEGKS
jgi:acetyl-CoA/propionyl-CoA carboxylase biotin carboxyl carrier protein